MRTIGIYFIFVAVFLRAVIVLADRPEFPVAVALLVVYGCLLFSETGVMRRRPLRFLQSPNLQLAYQFLQSILVITILILASYEDFLAMLFIPLSLEAVSFFGRRVGYMSIAIFSLAMILTLLFSEVGPLFGLAMGILYSGVCFLFSGYTHQVQKAEAAQAQSQRLFDDLQIAHCQLQGYADQVTSLAGERERACLARELHDSVTQTVFSMNLAVQSAHLLLEKEPSRVAGQLFHLEELATSAQREIQALVLQLRPRSLAEEGLPTALHQLAAEQKAINGLQVSLVIQGEGNLSETVAIGLYAIAHEALINVAKHSGTREAMVHLNLAENRSCLEVEDHGLGFDPEVAFGQRGHLGLVSISERAREMGWHLAIVSRPGRGTHILVTEKPTEDLK